MAILLHFELARFPQHTVRYPDHVLNLRLANDHVSLWTNTFRAVDSPREYWRGPALEKNAPQQDITP